MVARGLPKQALTTSGRGLQKTTSKTEICCHREEEEDLAGWGGGRQGG